MNNAADYLKESYKYCSKLNPNQLKELSSCIETIQKWNKQTHIPIISKKTNNEILNDALKYDVNF